LSYLADTHVLLWWVHADRRLPKSHARVLRRARDEAPLLVSDISLWEIAMLADQQRIRLDRPLRDWLEAATAPPLVQRVGITPAIAAETACLPSTFHRDPADRILVATARILGATLLTVDERITSAAIVPTLT
jgi:PIN domain nuclease of toxin-antitoxin system